MPTVAVVVKGRGVGGGAAVGVRPRGVRAEEADADGVPERDRIAVWVGVSATNG